ncbi:cyclin-A1 [Dicentrarchus labrax]|uniref:cyclin-A1 n=1 Tax=Dicentrarchus labrax TaxID=13489 RepID=UPI0021F529A5|nr:cyclin-A1 [Dicentrarchus labrax]
MMNFSTNAHCGGHTSKENIPPSSKTDALQFQRTKQRTVLGVLPENEQRGRSLSQGSQFSKQSSISDNSQFAFLGCPSSSSYDVYVEEACEVVLAASGQEVVSNSYYLDTETAALQNQDLRLLLELSLNSCQDASMLSEPDESLTSEEVLCVFEYAEDIHRHLRESEMRFRPRPGYLEQHPEITKCMRVILVDWLVEVVQEYKLRSETLHLAVNYLDRFLSCTAYVRRGKLQLVGTAALMIAAKYEEIFPPELNEFVYTTDSTYTKKQLIRMENVFLKVLAFKMAAPTANQFLRLFISIHSVCTITENIALYVAELSLLEIDPFVQYTPSTVAAGAYCLATYTVNKSLWPDSLHAFTGYTMADIVPCLTDLHKLYISAESRPQQAIREKYKTSKHCHVSVITPPAVLPFL